MLFIQLLLASLAIGSILWSIIQIIKPELFFQAEQAANVNRVRPTWYLVGGVIGLICLVLLWIVALSQQKTSVWILTGLFTVGSLKPLGIVFFYDKFSSQVSGLVSKMETSKVTNTTIILSRIVLSIILTVATLYFMGVFGAVV